MNSLRNVLLSLMASAFIAVPLAHAQGGISISPLISELRFEPGQTYQQTIQVTNRDLVPLEISIEPFDIQIQPDTHGVSFLPEASRRNVARSLAAWMGPDNPASFILQPGEQESIELDISVPEEASAGDYFASLNVYYRSTLADTQANILIKQSVGSLLLVSIGAANEARAAAPNDYESQEPILSIGRDLVSIETMLKNNTLRYIRVKPLITITAEDDEILYQREAEPKRIFPGENAKLLQDFPSTYLTSVEPLKARILLASIDGKQSYYESVVDLAEYQAVYDPNRKLPISPVTLAIAAGVILLGVLGFWLVWRRGR